MWSRFVSLLLCFALLLSLPVLAVEAPEDAEGFDFSKDSSLSVLYKAFGIDLSDADAVNVFLSFLNCVEADSFEQFKGFYEALNYNPNASEIAYLLYCYLHDSPDASTFTITPSTGGKYYRGEHIGLAVSNDGSYVALGYYPSGGSFVEALDISDLNIKISSLPTSDQFSKLLDYVRQIQDYVKTDDPTTSLDDRLAFLADLFQGTVTAYIRTMISNGTVKDEPISIGLQPKNWVAAIIQGLSLAITNVGRPTFLQVKNIYDYFNAKKYSASFQLPATDGQELFFRSINSTGFFDLFGQFFMNQITATTNSYIMLKRLLIGNDFSQVYTSFDYDEEGNLVEQERTMTNVVQTLIAGFEDIGLDLAKLQYVLADEDDISLKKATTENQKEFENQFTGDGNGSVDKNDISDAAGLTSSVSDLFQTDVSSSDFFRAFSDNSALEFFTQPVANDLDTVGSAATFSAVDDDDDLLSVLDDFVFDDDGFGTVKDSSFFDVSSLLGKGG